MNQPKLRYDKVAMALHWLIAFAFIGMLVLGYVMSEFPKGSPERAMYFGLHKSIGVVLGLAILVRIGWRLTHPAPALPAEISSRQALASKVTHFALYALMFMLPATGYLGASFGKTPLVVFGTTLPQWASESAVVRKAFFEVHEMLAGVAVALIALHVAAALWHFVSHGPAMRKRMLP